MEIASLRETVNFENKVNAVSPYNLGQVLGAFATQDYVAAAIATAVIDPSQIDLHEYAKKTDIPTKLSELINDANYVQTVGGKIPNEFLPSFVDDVLEYASLSNFPRPGEAGKIYIALDTNLTYRWGGSEYVLIGTSLCLGETHSTAYYGDLGKVAYEHSQATGNPHNLTLGDLGILATTAEINNLTGLNTNIVTALNGKLSLTGGTMTGTLTLAGNPVGNYDAATKLYIDTAINGISVTVTQNVTKISELTQKTDALTTTVGAQAETLVEVESDISGLKQTTSNHTTSIATLDQRADGFDRTISQQSESITTLEATVNLLEIELQKEYVIIVVDSQSKPLASNTDSTPFVVKFAGDVVQATVTTSGSVTGTTIAINNSNVNITYDTTNAVADGIYTINASYSSGGVSYTASKTISVSCVPKGDDGTAGRSVTGIQEWYYKSTSRTTTTGGTWITTSPISEDGYFIWTKTVFSYSSGNPTETVPICVTGDPGVIGEDGTSITGVDVLYYQSDSATTLTGGSWSTTAPTWINGKYIWTKNRVYYLDGEGTTWSEDSEPISITGSNGRDGEGTIISDTPPLDTTELWVNTEDGNVYYFESSGAAGKNMLDKDQGFQNGYISASGVYTADVKNALFNHKVTVDPTETYTVSFNDTVSNFVVSYYGNNDTFLGRKKVENVSALTIGNQANPFPNGTSYIRLAFNYNNSSTVTQTIIDSLEAQIELGSSRTSYEPFDPGGSWVQASDYSANIQDLGTRITENDAKAQNYAANAAAEILSTVYTKTEVDAKISENVDNISESWTRTITESTALGNEAYTKVTSLEASIIRGMDPQTGKPYIELNTGEADGFSLKISNDSIIIMQGGNEVSRWLSDKFDVATVITNSLGLGNFEFVIKQDTGGLCFKHK